VYEVNPCRSLRNFRDVNSIINGGGLFGLLALLLLFDHFFSIVVNRSHFGVKTHRSNRIRIEIVDTLAFMSLDLAAERLHHLLYESVAA
jgi:hypothetical protein